MPKRSRLLLASAPGLVPECPTSGPAVPTDTIYNLLTSLGLTSNLKACFDAGDSASYGGSGTVVTNRTGSGVNLNFVGTPAPAFVGVAGAKDGTDYFTIAAQTAGYGTLSLQLTSMPSWANFGTKGTSFTAAAWVLPRPGTSPYMFHTMSSGSSCESSTGLFIYDTGNANGPNLLFGGSYGACSSLSNMNMATGLDASTYATGLTFNCWNFIAVSVAEGVAGGAFFYVNGAYAPITKQVTPGSSTWNTFSPTNTVNLTYATSAGYAQNMWMGGATDTSSRLHRLAAALMWQNAATSGGNLSKAQLDQIYNATKARYGR